MFPRTAPPGPQPPQPPADEIVQSAQAIQKKLIDNCMARPSCRASLLSDDSYANGKIPPYDPATAAHSWEEVRRGAQPGG